MKLTDYCRMLLHIKAYEDIDENALAAEAFILKNLMTDKIIIPDTLNSHLAKYNLKLISLNENQQANQQKP